MFAKLAVPFFERLLGVHKVIACIQKKYMYNMTCMNMCRGNTERCLTDTGRERFGQGSPERRKQQTHRLFPLERPIPRL